ncbi:MAG: DUF2007 domain-containing protein [Chloroflexota bacterium]|nr:DUF2007 domain-containing protein [Chloroflexota bacterium]
MRRKPSRFSDLTAIYTATGLIRAQVIKAKLEAAGIPVLLDYESVGPVIGITVDGLGEVRVLVSNKNAEEARSLIEEEQDS